MPTPLLQCKRAWHQISKPVSVEDAIDRTPVSGVVSLGFPADRVIRTRGSVTSG